jgi:hypothetical protein
MLQRLFNFLSGTKISSSQVNSELDQLVGAINTEDTELDSHANNKGNPHNVTSEQINVLTANSLSNSSGVDKYPLGFSVMRISGGLGGWPEDNANLETTKTTSQTATQKLISTTTSGSVLTRNTSAGAWQDWQRIDGGDVQHGSASVTSAGNDLKTVNVTFPIAYASSPDVVATVLTGAPNSRAVGVTNITTTGFTLNVWNAGGALTIVTNWIAKGAM